jgi:hypothetical protein
MLSDATEAFTIPDCSGIRLTSDTQGTLNLHFYTTFPLYFPGSDIRFSYSLTQYLRAVVGMNGPPGQLLSQSSRATLL